MMGDVEYNVSWEKYSEAVVTNFGRLVEDDVFTDVTLVSNDENYIKAHKAVLSLNSPFFKTFLTSHPHSHPLIYLESLTYEDLKNLMNFIYLGETKVIHDDLNNFLAIGQKFKLQGMADFKVKQETLKTKSKEDPGNLEVELDEPIPINSTKEISKAEISKAEISKAEISKEEISKEEISKEEISKEEISKEEISREEISQEEISQEEISKEEISKEMEEIGNVEEECKPEYEKGESMGGNPSDKYQCSQCDYTASYVGTLKYHRRSKHDGLKYPCKTCDYRATSLGSLSRHKRNVHDGEKYPCDTCSFKASSKDSLKTHIKSQHEGVRFPCTTCDYEATQQAKLKQHIRKNHTLSG